MCHVDHGLFSVFLSFIRNLIWIQKMPSNKSRNTYTIKKNLIGPNFIHVLQQFSRHRRSSEASSEWSVWSCEILHFGLPCSFSHDSQDADNQIWVCDWVNILLLSFVGFGAYNVRNVTGNSLYVNSVLNRYSVILVRIVIVSQSQKYYYTLNFEGKRSPSIIGNL